jgi:hypothetical protein
MAISRRVKLPAPAFAEAASRRQAQGGASSQLARDKKQSLFFRQRLTKKGEGDDGFQGIRGRTDRFNQKFR